MHDQRGSKTIFFQMRRLDHRGSKIGRDWAHSSQARRFCQKPGCQTGIADKAAYYREANEQMLVSLCWKMAPRWTTSMPEGRVRSSLTRARQGVRPAPRVAAAGCPRLPA